MSYLPYEEYLSQQLGEQRLQAALQEAAVAQLLGDAGIDQRGWFSSQSVKLVSAFGRLLVEWGGRLERYGTPSRRRSLRHQAI
jgi:hypothetical protein